MEGAKKPWFSKTVWSALIVALSAFFPPVEKFIVENPMAYAQILAALFFVLRIISKEKIVIQ